MPRIRAGQINDLTLRYNPYPVPPVVGSSVSITGGAFTSLLALTKTGTLGGSSGSTSAFIKGVSAEPFTGIVAGDSFTIKVPDFIGGNPITVTFQSGDFVLLNGVLTTTAARVVSRVNAAMSAAGAAFNCCSSQDGVLQFVSVNNVGYTSGSTTGITLTEVTTSILQRLGLGPVSIITVPGVKGPKRGIATVSGDNLGSYVPLKTTSFEELSTRTSSFFHAGNRSIIPDSPGGFPVFGRVSAISGGVKLTFLARMKSRPIARSRFSDFNALTVGETIAIQVQDAFSGLNITTNPTVASTITTVQQVADLINAAWQTDTAVNGAGARQAVITGRIPEPFNLAGCQMTLSLNNDTPLSVSFTGERSATEVVASINNVVAGAAQTAQGGARVFTDSGGRKYVEIYSSSVTGDLSTVSLTQANFTPGTGMTLERLGLPPVLIRGWDLARVVGAEVHIVNPGRDGSISITGGSTTLNRFGLSGYSGVVGTVVDDLYYNIASNYLSMIPELQDVGDVSDSYEESVQRFIDLDPYPLPADGPFPANAGLSMTAGQNGQLPPAALPKAFDFLSVDDVTFGSRKLGSDVDAVSPRRLAPFRPGSTTFTLVEESAISGVSSVRSYMRGDGVKVLTVNAKWTPGSAVWSKDSTASASSKTEFRSDGAFLFSRASGVGTWAEGGWAFLSFANELTQSTGALAVGVTAGTVWKNTLFPSGTNVQDRLDAIVAELADVSIGFSGSERVGSPARSALFTGARSLTAGSIADHLLALLNFVSAPFRTRSLVVSDGSTQVMDPAGNLDSILLLTAISSGFSLQLPDPANNAGRKIIFIDKSGTLSPTNKVTLLRSGFENIDGVAASYFLQTEFGRWTIACDGSDWYIL